MSADAIETLREWAHEDVEIGGDGRRLIGPGGTELVNGQQKEPDSWIDRRSKWGSPFRIEEDGGSYEREESVRLYRGWLLGNIEQNRLDPEVLRGDVLGCHCLPELCHGVVVLSYLARTYDRQRTLDDAF